MFGPLNVFTDVLFSCLCQFEYLFESFLITNSWRGVFSSSSVQSESLLVYPIKVRLHIKRFQLQICGLATLWWPTLAICLGHLASLEAWWPIHSRLAFLAFVAFRPIITLACRFHRSWSFKYIPSAKFSCVLPRFIFRWERASVGSFAWCRLFQYLNCFRSFQFFRFILLLRFQILRCVPWLWRRWLQRLRWLQYWPGSLLQARMMKLSFLCEISLFLLFVLYLHCDQFLDIFL